MALANSFAALVDVTVLGILFIAFGRRILRWSKLESSSLIENLVFAAAIGVITFEALISLVAHTGHCQPGIATVLAAILFAAIPEIRSVLQDLGGLFGSRAALELSSRWPRPFVWSYCYKALCQWRRLLVLTRFIIISPQPAYISAMDFIQISSLSTAFSPGKVTN